MPPSSGSPTTPGLSALISALSTPLASQHRPQQLNQHLQQVLRYDQQLRQAAFQALRPVTTQLLALRDQADRLQPQLLELRRLLETLPATGVAACWDYVAFPLMILLDSVVPSRQRARQGPGGSSRAGNIGDPGPTAGASGPYGVGAGGDRTAGDAEAESSEVEEDVVAPACRSDRVVEALLDTLQVLLEKSPGPGPGPDGGRDPTWQQHHPANEAQLSALQRLAPLLQLPRDSASEEVHRALQRCLQAALAPLAAAARAWAEGAGPSAGAGSATGESGGGGRPVFCCEERASLAGYLVHCCLEVAEGEVLAGHRGSKSLCAAALASLGLLLDCTPDPDMLAFFLPGVVSGLSKHLLTAGAAAALSGPSVPPGAAATIQALSCLQTAILTVLSDKATAAIMGDVPYICGGDVGGDGGPAAPSASIHKAEDALSALQALSLSSSASIPTAAAVAGAAKAATVGSAPLAVTAAAAAPLQPSQQQQQHRRPLCVDRTLPWLEETSGRINSLLSRALPPLAPHPRPAVRAALASTCVMVLDGCGRSLAPSQPLLLRLLFTLAQDEWQQVAAPCRDWVARRTAVAAEGSNLVAAASDGAAVSGAAAGGASGVALVLREGSGGAGGAERKGRDGREEGPAGAVAESEGGRTGSCDAGGDRRTAELKALEDEFERFMQGLTSDSALLEPPALELDELELYGGDGAKEGAAGGRGQDQNQMAAAASACGGSTQGTVAGGATPTGSSPSAPLPKPAPPLALPGLQQLITATATSSHLLRSVRAGEAEAVVAARCLTTALMVAGPARAAEWLLLRPAALSDLLAGIFRCFAFDRSAALLVLHLSGEAGAHAPAVSASGSPASMAAAAAGLPPQAQLNPTARAPGTPMVQPVAGTAGLAGTGDTVPASAPALVAAAQELPRMPVGLLHLVTQRSYAAVAAVARSLGWLARAADVQAAAAGGAFAASSAAGAGLLGGRSFSFSPGPGSVPGGVLRRLMDELTHALRAAERRRPSPLGQGGEISSGAAGGRRTAADPEDLGEEDEEQPLVERGPLGPALVGSAGEPSWQCEAAAVVAVLAEVVIGASNAWVPPLETPQTPQAAGQVAGQPPEQRLAGSADKSAAGAGAATAFPAVDPGFEAVLLSVLQELMRPSLLRISTHNSSSGATGYGVTPAAAPRATAAPLSYDYVVHSELAAARQPLSAQALGENVMLLRALLEVVGTAARAAGPRFSSKGRLLRTVLVPLLELLGDPQPSVAASADAALRSICAHCGYGGSLTALIGRNADYVVDALCGRLRDLQRHPRAPHLLAALLRRAGVAPQMLPLMAEPLQRALQGLSVLARHWSPHYAHCYLAALRELTAGAAAEAQAAAAHSQAEVAELNRQAAEARDRLEQPHQHEAAAAAAAASGKAAAFGGGAAAERGPGGHEEVRRYFMGRTSAATAGKDRGLEHGGDGDGAEGGEGEEGPSGDSGGRSLLTLTAGQLEEAELRFRRLHAAAVVAGAAADAATPLLLSADLRSAIAALEVLRRALTALAASTPAVEAEAAVVEEYGGAEARMRPVRPETPKVLPAVAAAWGPLMAALRDARTPVVECAVAAVAELVAVAGGTFLTRRFQQEAWPVLQRLLATGTAHTPGLLSLGTVAVRAAAAASRLLEPPGSSGSALEGGVRGGEAAAGSLAPAAVTRVRAAALGCLEAVCRCGDAAAAVRTMTWNIAQAALPFLGASHPRQLHEAAQATLLAVAALDPDGVWLLLYDTSYNTPPSLLGPPACVSALDQQSAPRRGEQQRQQQMQPQQQRYQPATGAAPVVIDRTHVPPPPPGPSFPPLRTLLPPLPGIGAGGGNASKRGGLASGGGGFSSAQQWAVTAGTAADCGPRAQALLDVVAACPVPWHATQVPLDVA